MMMAIALCAIMKSLLKTLLLLYLKAPLVISIGLNLNAMTAGIIPHNKAVNPNTIKYMYTYPLEKRISIGTGASSSMLTYGRLI